MAGHGCRRCADRSARRAEAAEQLVVAEAPRVLSDDARLDRLCVLRRTARSRSAAAIVLSMLCHSSSRSRLSASNRRCQNPLRAQRSNRLNTVFHEPNSRGRSRQGAPVRLHHSTASTKLRSSRPGRPAPFLAPRTADILCHCRSSNCRRTIVLTLGAHLDHHGKPIPRLLGHGHVYGPRIQGQTLA